MMRTQSSPPCPSDYQKALSPETDFPTHAAQELLDQFNAAIDACGEKRDQLAALAGMSGGNFARRTHDPEGFVKVLATAPHSVIAEFLRLWAPSRGIEVHTIPTAQLTDELVEALSVVMRASRVLVVRGALGIARRG
jgi:hypothetical protein